MMMTATASFTDAQFAEFLMAKLRSHPMLATFFSQMQHGYISREEFYQKAIVALVQQNEMIRADIQTVANPYGNVYPFPPRRDPIPPQL